MRWKCGPPAFLQPQGSERCRHVEEAFWIYGPDLLGVVRTPFQPPQAAVCSHTGLSHGSLFTGRHPPPLAFCAAHLWVTLPQALPEEGHCVSEVRAQLCEDERWFFFWRCCLFQEML